MKKKFKVGDKVYDHFKGPQRVISLDYSYKMNGYEYFLEHGLRYSEQSLSKEKPTTCPDCESYSLQLKDVHVGDYKELKYYYCNCCEETFVSQDGGELAISA